MSFSGLLFASKVIFLFIVYRIDFSVYEMLWCRWLAFNPVKWDFDLEAHHCEGPFDREQWTRGSGAVCGAVKRFHGNADVTQEMPRTLY